MLLNHDMKKTKQKNLSCEGLTPTRNTEVPRPLTPMLWGIVRRVLRQATWSKDSCFTVTNGGACHTWHLHEKKGEIAMLLPILNSDGWLINDYLPPRKIGRCKPKVYQRPGFPPQETQAPGGAETSIFRWLLPGSGSSEMSWEQKSILIILMIKL